MNMRMSSIVLLAAVSVLGPMLRSSDAGGRGPFFRDVVLYELNEQAQFTVIAERLHRVAMSGLEGKARRGTPLCTEELMVHAEKLFMARQLTMKDAGRCTVVAFGNSDLDVTDRDRDLGIVQGTIEGQLYVVVNSKLTNLTDAPELVVMSGSFKGTVVVTDAAIITITEGTLTGDGAPPTFCPGGCKFTGKFRQPFTVHDVAVYKKDNGRLVPVLADERALGDPTVRLEITFGDD